MNSAPVITIDGPSGTGKGTIGQRLSQELGWPMLDSGIIYRAIGWAVIQQQISLEDTQALSRLLKEMTLEIEQHPQGSCVRCNGQDVTEVIRDEQVGMVASEASALPLVRQAALPWQRAFRKSPGLIADGRDMGTVVFPDAFLKVYLDADLEERAIRRYQQLQQKGISVSLRQIRDHLALRDRQDQERTISPTRPADDALVIDTTGLSVEAVLAKVLQEVRSRHGSK